MNTIKKPKLLSEFVGQEKTRDNLSYMVKAALKRKLMPGHFLLYGPPGLGKTTLVEIVASELKAKLYATTGGELSTKAEVYNIIELIRANQNILIFIDEIHRMPKKCEEIFYAPMQDFIIGDEKLPAFTLAGATISPGMLSKPFRDRFRHQYGLDFYSEDEIIRVVRFVDSSIPENISREIASRSHGVPRIGITLLLELQNTFFVRGHTKPSLDDIKSTLDRLQIDRFGLTMSDRRIMKFLYDHRKPAGEKTICGAIQIGKDDLYFIHDPVLMKNSFIRRTPRGRELTEDGRKYMDELWKK